MLCGVNSHFGKDVGDCVSTDVVNETDGLCGYSIEVTEDHKHPKIISYFLHLVAHVQALLVQYKILLTFQLSNQPQCAGPNGQ